jgi:hypothetical protein
MKTWVSNHVIELISPSINTNRVVAVRAELIAQIEFSDVLPGDR